MGKDKLTYFVSKAINTIFLYNIVGTSRGVLLGVVLASIQDLIASYFPPVGLIRGYGFIAFGILIFNIKPFVKKKYLDPNIEKQLAYIRQVIKEGKFTESEERALWRKVINSILSEYNQTANNSDDLHNPTPE